MVNYITCSLLYELVEPQADLYIYLRNGSSFSIEANVPPYANVSSSLMGALNPSNINNIVL